MNNQNTDFNVPVLEGLTVVATNSPNYIVQAQSDTFIEQLVSTGNLNEDTFEGRIEKLIKLNRESLVKKKVETNYMYYKDYNNGTFDFKIFVQDLFITKDETKNLVRTFLAYFVDPKTNIFYHFDLSYGPLVMPTELIKVNEIDLKNDEITRSLEKMYMDLINEIKYK